MTTTHVLLLEGAPINSKTNDQEAIKQNRFDHANTHTHTYKNKRAFSLPLHVARLQLCIVVHTHACTHTGWTTELTHGSQFSRGISKRLLPGEGREENSQGTNEGQTTITACVYFSGEGSRVVHFPAVEVLIFGF